MFGITAIITVLVMWLARVGVLWYDPTFVNAAKFAALGILAYSLIFGLRKIPVGSGASLLFLGARVRLNLGEGYQWVFPPLLWLQTEDLRERTQKLDNLEVFTKDNVRVNIDASIMFEVINPSRFQSVGTNSITTGLDDLTDQILREETRAGDLSEMLGHAFRARVATRLHNEAKELSEGSKKSEGWGIRITRVPVPAIRPDPKVIEALSLERVKEAERQAHRVEFTDLAERMAQLPADLNGVQRLEGAQVQLRVVPKEIKENVVRLDQGILDALQAIAGQLINRLRP